MSTKRGKFIVIDGGEGAGTTTLTEYLAKEFGGFATREPGGTKFGEDMRHLVLKSTYAKDLDAATQFFAMFSARRHHIQKVIAPALEKGITVFCDRFDSSTFAYQISVESKLRDIFVPVRELALEKCKPDIYIFLDLPPEKGLARVAERKEKKDHFEKRALDFHEQVRKGYRHFAELGLARCEFLDATAPLKEVKKSVASMIRPLI